ncbi:hypothetical protein CRI94_09420 [Longibacter salinarum]|uniref:Uncharacterized protein n=1 Tax=Longibacter salinarum TaxID=1850348 RepID=A0A2A8CY42_9BACT|nr:hypothetical protein CRI94_09420 [Longibacter salinarum]
MLKNCSRKSLPLPIVAAPRLQPHQHARLQQPFVQWPRCRMPVRIALLPAILLLRRFPPDTLLMRSDSFRLLFSGLRLRHASLCRH